METRAWGSAVAAAGVPTQRMHITVNPMSGRTMGWSTRPCREKKSRSGSPRWQVLRGG